MVSKVFLISRPLALGKKKIPNLDESLHQEYADSSAELVKLRREAKVNGNFFVEPEAIFERG